MEIRSIIEPTTLAAKSVFVMENWTSKVRVDCTGLGVGESCAIEIPNTEEWDSGNDADWEQMYIEGVAVSFGYQQDNSFLFNAFGVYRLNKTATVAESSVTAYIKAANN